jgi:penicillin amidase
LQFLQQELGDILGDWQWGKIHQLTLQHPLGRQKPLNNIFTAGPFPLGGSGDTVNKAEYRLYRPFDVDAGPSMRMIIDLARPDVGLHILPGGQSGQAFDQHYQDQVDLWRNGEYRKVPMRRDEIATTCTNVLVLQPGSQAN